MISRATCSICDTKTERRELPSGASASGIDVTKVVSYWCPTCRRWEATDETATDAPPFLDRLAKVPETDVV